MVALRLNKVRACLCSCVRAVDITWLSLFTRTCWCSLFTRAVCQIVTCDMCGHIHRFDGATRSKRTQTDAPTKKAKAAEPVAAQEPQKPKAPFSFAGNFIPLGPKPPQEAAKPKGSHVAANCKFCTCNRTLFILLLRIRLASWVCRIRDARRVGSGEKEEAQASSGISHRHQTTLPAEITPTIQFPSTFLLCL